MLAQCVTSNGKHTPARSWSTSWKRNAWMKRLSTLTLPRSTVSLGVESWISSLRACRASPTALPESGRGTPTSEATAMATDQSRAPSESSMKCDPPWSTLKMCQLGLLPESDGFSQSGSDYAEWVMRCKTRSLLLRQALERRTSGSAFSLWPSTRSEDAESCGNHPGAVNWQAPATDSFRSRGGDRKDEMGLDQQSRFWTTPQAHDITERGSGQIPTAAAGNACLARDARTWATPKTISGGANSKRDERGAGGPDLQEMVNSWPTPAARDHKGANSEEHATLTGGGRKHMGQLANFVEFSPPAQAIADGQKSSSDTPGSRRRLNPAFAAWLMGIPWWWTSPGQINCAQSAMEQYRSASRQQLSSLLEGLE